MADSKIIEENDDEPIIVEVEKIPTPAEIEAKGAETEDDKGDEEDARLVVDDDDDEDADATDAGTPAHKKRVKRRQIQKQARDRTLAELNELRQWKQTTEARLAGMETAHITQSESQIDERLSKVRDDISLAERILAKAVEAGNGDDVTAALRLRDEAKAQESELTRTKGSFSDIKRNAPDPKVVNLSNEWKSANSGWYGTDETATNIAKQIDGQVAADGYNPATPAYWQELSRRLESRFRAATPPAANDTKKKTPPPQGQTREHVPVSTRREVYVTPERKQAMIDANIWDDIPRRNKMLKAYADFDRDQSAS